MTRKAKKPSCECAECGMMTNHPAQFHPFAACMMFAYGHNGKQVQNNLRAVVEYGMKAQRKGVSLDDAMRLITTVKP